MLHSPRRRCLPLIMALIAGQLLSAVPMVSVAQSLPAFDAMRTMTQQASVQQAIYALAAESTDSDSDGYLEPPAMGVGSGPVGGGIIPASSGATKADGYGVLLGYCAWDNGAVASSTNRLNGGLGLNRVSLAVITAGIDNIFQTSCADLAAATLRGDDYALWYTGTQLAQGVGGTVHWGAPVSDLTTLNGISTSALMDGEVRLVKASNKMYRYTAGTGWFDLASSGSTVSSATNLAGGAVGTLSYQSAADTTAMLAANASATKMFLSQTSSALSWSALAASDVGLGNVENTRLSTWAGSNNITTLGTITSGIWNGSTLDINAGGTGLTAVGPAGYVLTSTGGAATWAPPAVVSAVANLIGGVAGSVPYQSGPGITAMTAAGTSGQLLVANGSGLPTFVTLSGDGTLVAGGALTLANSGVTAGTYNSAATTHIPFIVDAKGRITGTGAAVTIAPAWSSITGTPTTLAGYGISDAASASGAQTLTNKTLGAGSIWNGGTIGVAYGGTGAATFTSNGLLYGNGTSAVGATAAGTSGQLLVANGSGLPTFVTLSGDGTLAVGGALTLANSGVTAGTYNSAATTHIPFTIDAKGRITGTGAAVTIAPAWSSITGTPTTLAGYGISDAASASAAQTLTNKTLGAGSVWNGGTIGVAYGGTGATTFTSNGLLYGNGTSAVGATAAGTSGQLLVANGSGLPTFVTLSGDGTLAAGGALTLANSGVTAGTYNNVATAITPFTVDAKGRVTGTGAAVTMLPDWSNVANKPVNVTALAGLTGANGALPYFTGVGTMAALGAGTSGYVLTSNGVAAPSWAPVSATTATNLAGGAAGSMPYQTGAGTTAMLLKGTDGQMLTLVSGLPAWQSGGAVDWTQPGTIGSVTPNTGSFTNLNVTGSTRPTNGIYLQAANSLGFSTNGTERVRLTSAGILCVNCASSIPTGSNNPYYITVNGNILAARFDGTSDARLKTNVVSISNALSKVRALRGVGFDWRTDIPGKQLPSGRDIGFLAQELEVVLPELVHTDAWGFRAVNYSGVIPVAIEAIKELDTVVTRHDNILKHFSKPDANTLVLDIAVLKATSLLAEELGVKKIMTPVIEMSDSFRINDKASKQTRFEIDAAGRVMIDTLAIGRDVSVAGNSTITGLQTAGAFVPTSSVVPGRGLYAPSERSLGLATENKLMAELESRGLAVYGDIFVGDAGAVKRVVDKQGFIYAANEITSGNACMGKMGAIGKDVEGNLFVCR